MEYHYLAVTNVFEGINTYGIAAFADSDGDAILIESFADLSPDEQSVSRLVSDCNELELDPTQLRGIVDDFLAQF